MVHSMAVATLVEDLGNQTFTQAAALEQARRIGVDL